MRLVGLATLRALGMAATSLNPVQGAQAALFGLGHLVSSSEKFRFFVVSELALLA